MQDLLPFCSNLSIIWALQTSEPNFLQNDDHFEVAAAWSSGVSSSEKDGEGWF